MNARVWKGQHHFDCFYFWDIVVGPDVSHQIQTVFAAQRVMSVRRDQIQTVFAAQRVMSVRRDQIQTVFAAQRVMSV